MQPRALAAKRDAGAATPAKYFLADKEPLHDAEALLLNMRSKKLFTFVSNTDSLDWKDYGADKIIDRVCGSKNLAPGAIILCHNGAKYTADALDAMLTKLEEEGYKVVPISELIYRENYHMDFAGKQIKDE